MACITEKDHPKRVIGKRSLACHGRWAVGRRVFSNRGTLNVLHGSGRVACAVRRDGVPPLAHPTKAYTLGPFDLMPAISTGGGSLAEFGLHYDETLAPDFGGYDYSAGVGTPTYIRAKAEGDQYYPTRFKYWTENSCQVTGRLQQYIGGAWYDYWQYDVHLYHVAPNVPYVSYTSYVQYAND